MCSRYELNGTFGEIKLRFDIPSIIKTISPFNGLAEIRPTDQIPIITNENKMVNMHWGLIVDWNKSPIINARSETIHQKPIFQAMLQNRCIVPATAYFEWRKEGGLKIKTRIYQQDQKIISFAGLFVGDNFTIITSRPASSIAHIHNRMPVILDHADEAVWLSSGNSFHQVSGLLKTKEDGSLFSQEIPPSAKKLNKQQDLFN